MTQEKKINLQPPRGTRDFLPNDMAIRNHVERIVRSSFESFGFQQVQTPIFEQSDLITVRSGEDVKKEMIIFVSDSSRYALRPELTSPVCRLIASDSLAGSPLPYKLYYFGPCFRYLPQPERSREFYQAGIELVGHREPVADAEVIAVAVKVLNRLQIQGYRLRLGDVGVFRELLEEFFSTQEASNRRERTGGEVENVHSSPSDLSRERQSRVISDIYKIMHIEERCRISSGQPNREFESFLREETSTLLKIQADIGYVGEHRIASGVTVAAADLPRVTEATYRAWWVNDDVLPEEKADLVLRLARIRGSASEAIPAARALLAGTTALRPLEDLAEVCDWLQAFGVTDFEVILGMTRYLDFYTGTVFEIDASPGGTPRTLCGGGRYDNLVEVYGGPSIPATGFAFSFDRLVEVLVATEAAKVKTAPVDVSVISPPTRKRLAVEIAELLREGVEGLRVGLGLSQSELADQLRYCEQIGVEIVVTVGLEGLDQDQCKIQERPSGREAIVKRSQLLEEIERLVKGKVTRK